MNLKTLAVLLAAAVIAVSAAIWMKSERSGEAQSSITNTRLLPGLDQNINDVGALRVIKAGGDIVAELKPGEQGWVVASKHGYPADIGQVRETLLALAAAEIIEQKTANPEYYDRLGVQDVSAAEAAGVQVDIEGIEPAVSLIVGDTATGGREGTYVRRAGEDTSYLIGASITVPRDTRDWLDRALVDIPAGDIQSIAIRHPDGAALTLSKDSREQADFTVAGVPDGRELNAPAAANSLAGALTALTLDDVLPASELDPNAHQGVSSEYRTFDGLTVTAKTFTADDKRYVHFDLNFDEEQAQRFAKSEKPDSEAETTAEKPAEDTDEAAGAADPAASAMEKAARLEARLDPWVYSIASYKQDNMTKRMDDLLKPLAESEPEPAGENLTE